MRLTRSARWRSSSSRRTRLPGEAGMKEKSMLDVGDRSNVEVRSPPCFLEMGWAEVRKVDDVLDVPSRRVMVRLSGLAAGVGRLPFLIARVGLGGGESVDLKLRPSREERWAGIPALPGVSSKSNVMLSDMAGRAMDDAKLLLRCRCCFSFRSGVAAVVERTGLRF